jgi:hypothetical protein
MQQPGGPPSDVILHVNLRDPTNEQQQEAVGILGVNLLYAVTHALTGPHEFLSTVSEELNLKRVEIDSLELIGPAFEKWDKREVHALLVTGGFAEVVVFPVDEEIAPLNEVLYKRALVLAPGRFGNLGQLHAELVRSTLAELPQEELKESKGALGLFCLSETPGMELQETPSQVVKLVDGLQRLGYGVLLFRSPELYAMSALVNRYTKFRIHFAVGLSVLVHVLEDQYKSLPGSLLEGIARLFTQNVRLVVHPMATKELEQWAKKDAVKGWTWEETDGMVYAENLHPAKPLDYLYKYLMSEFWILPSKTAVR